MYVVTYTVARGSDITKPPPAKNGPRPRVPKEAGRRLVIPERRGRPLVCARDNINVNKPSMELPAVGGSLDDTENGKEEIWGAR